MQLDTDQLRKHYASLSDHALAEIKRDELLDAAQKMYDTELEERKRAQSFDSYADIGSDGKPAWLADAAQVFTLAALPGQDSAQEADTVKEALKAARIPCFLEAVTIQVEASPACEIHEWRIFVPGNLNQHAMNIIQVDLENDTFEGKWKTHLRRTFRWGPSRHGSKIRLLWIVRPHRTNHARVRGRTNPPGTEIAHWRILEFSGPCATRSDVCAPGL